MKPVFALDIDGTLVQYHRHFLEFASSYFGKPMMPNGYDSRLPLYRYMGVSKERYRKCKMAYRKGEMKRSVPLLPAPYPQADDLTRTLRKWGGEVWLCTTRPYLAYDHVDDATRENMRRHGVQYDHIMWGPNKYRDLRKAVGLQRIVAVLDDVPEMVGQAYGLGMPAAFALRPHNRHQYYALPEAEKKGWLLTETHDDTVQVLLALHGEWKAKQ